MSGWPRSIAASMTWRPACACGAATSGRASAGTLTRFGRAGERPGSGIATLPTRSASGSRRLRSRLDVAERSLDADLAEDRPHFTAAVEAELQGWDAFAERLQATAAAKTGSARDRAETGIKELRRRRLAVTKRLDDLHDAPQEAWREHQERVTAARDDLERMADDLSASLYLKEEHP